MAGYSGTPLPTKLGIKTGHRTCFLREPSTFRDSLGPLPEGITVATNRRTRGPFDVVVYFTRRQAELRRDFERLAGSLAQTGGLWISWPKRTSGIPTDLTEDVIRAIALEGGLVDNKVCAVDDIWSALRLVIRRRDRKPPTIGP
jgi:hypothetical protein